MQDAIDYPINPKEWLLGYESSSNIVDFSAVCSTSVVMQHETWRMLLRMNLYLKVNSLLKEQQIILASWRQKMYTLLYLT